MSGIKIIDDGGRRLRWSSAGKVRIVEETLEADFRVEPRDEVIAGSAPPAIMNTDQAARITSCSGQPVFGDLTSVSPPTVKAVSSTKPSSNGPNDP